MQYQDLRRNWARQFQEHFLWPDAEWLQEDPDGFTYWPTRLGQHFTLTCDPDQISDPNRWGRSYVVNWQMRMPIVDSVTQPEKALHLCLALNEFACGWSFHFDHETREMAALAAVCAPLDWDRYLLRFGQTAHLAAWLCESIAESLADEVGGHVAATHPSSQELPRRLPDAVTYIPTALRERPEWVHDLLPRKFDSAADIANFFAEAMSSFAQSVSVGDDGFLIDSSPEGDAPFVVGMFKAHPLLGLGWSFETHFPDMIDEAGHAHVANEVAWALFQDPTATLDGAVLRRRDALVYAKWMPTREIRGYTQLPSFDGYTPELLWGPASSCNQAIERIEQYASEASHRASVAPSVAESLERILAPLSSGGPILESFFPPPKAGEDRSMLWWALRAILLTQGWFNPMGPTWYTLEIRINPDTGADHLLAVQRHPTVPKYIDVAELHGDVDLVACLDEAMEVMCQGVLPNVVDVGTCPPELADIVVAALQRGWDGRLADSDLSYANTADHIRSTLGEPWGYAHHSHKTDRFADEIAKRPEVTKDATFADWLALASDQLNVEANIANMTNAWDGSLNFQNSHGTLGKGYFDRGPFFLRYSDFGTVDPHTGRDASHHPPR